MSDSKFVRHGACSECGSSDGVGWYDDGHGKCFVCDAYHPNNNGEEPQKKRQRMSDIPLTPVTNVFRAIPRRGLTDSSIQKYGIDVNMDKTVDVAHRYPYFRDGQHVANKVRRLREKNFYWEGDGSDAELFGQHLFPAGQKHITVVEGELDAPSAYQLLGSRWPVVSVKNAATAVEDCKVNYEYLNSFGDIVICFDKDEAKIRKDGTKFYPGQDAAKKVAELFAPGKCRIMTLQNGKDPSDYLQNNIDPRTFVDEWWRAAPYRPDGLIDASSTLDMILNPPEYFTVPYPWDALNKMTYGVRLSELMLFMADTGAGKTTVFKEIAYNLLTNAAVREAGYGVGFLHLEEPNYDTVLGLMSIHKNKPYHLPDTDRTEDELREAHEDLFGPGKSKAILYDSFGSNEIDVILNKVRHMAVMGCKYVFIDHLSIIVSDQSGDERKQLDEISTKLKTLTMELNIAVFCVIHTNRMGQARGSAGPEKVANMHFLLERDKKDANEWRRNVLKLSIEKNRFCGRTGPCLWMNYQPETGRLFPLDDDQITAYEAGGIGEEPW